MLKPYTDRQDYRIGEEIVRNSFDLYFRYHLILNHLSEFNHIVVTLKFDKKGNRENEKMSIISVYQIEAALNLIKTFS
jgi:hypothetical protein